VRQAEAPLGGERLTREVARNLFKLMAIKDEYEVARLLTAPSFREQVAAQFEGEWKMVFHFAPPAFSGALAWLTGRPSQVAAAGQAPLRTVGAAADAVAGQGRRIRGTWLDLLALTADRREDRAVWQEYEMLLTRLLPHLTRGNLALACRMAAVPDGIRGYGPVRHAAIASARAQWQTLWQQAFHGPLEE